MAQNRTDPFLAFNFAVEIHGLVVGGFREVSGLQSEAEVQDYREGGVNEFIHKRAGPIRYPANISLKTGITDSTALWSWYRDVAGGKVQRKNISIVLMDGAGQEQRRWNFMRAYPVKWVGPEFKALGSEVAIEAMELAHDGISPQ